MILIHRVFPIEILLIWNYNNKFDHQELYVLSIKSFFLDLMNLYNLLHSLLHHSIQVMVVVSSSYTVPSLDLVGTVRRANLVVYSAFFSFENDKKSFILFGIKYIGLRFVPFGNHSKDVIVSQNEKRDSLFDEYTITT